MELLPTFAARTRNALRHTEPDRPRCHEKRVLDKLEIILRGLGSWIFQLILSIPCPYFIMLSLDVKDAQHEAKKHM